MRLSFKKNTIIYPKGATRSDIVKELERRISKRKIEIERREWIVKQYESLVKKQAEDVGWLRWVENTMDCDWSPILDNGDITSSNV